MQQWYTVYTYCIWNVKFVLDKYKYIVSLNNNNDERSVIFNRLDKDWYKFIAKFDCWIS